LLKIDENSNEQNEAIKELKKSRKSVAKICNELCEIEFEPRETIAQLHEYIKSGNRIFYYSISDYIFGLSIEQQGLITNNVEKLYEYTCSDEYKNQICEFVDNDGQNMKLDIFEASGIWTYSEIIKKEKTIEEDDAKNLIYSFYSGKLRSIVIKLYDHVNLAVYQYSKLNHDDEYFERKIAMYGKDFNQTIDEKIGSFRDEMTRENNDKSRENINQLISLVGIFTALSFLVFGGVASLESIFSQIQNTDTLKLVLIASIWGIAIFNILSVFEYFVSRIANKSFRYCADKGASFFQKYPLFVIGNIILGTVFLCSAWLHFIDLVNAGYCYVESVREGMPVIGYVVVAVIILGMGAVLFVITRKKKVSNANGTEEGSEISE